MRASPKDEQKESHFRAEKMTAWTEKRSQFFLQYPNCVYMDIYSLRYCLALEFPAHPSKHLTSSADVTGGVNKCRLDGNDLLTQVQPTPASVPRPDWCSIKNLPHLTLS